MLAEGLLRRIMHEFGFPMHVILTGGLSRFHASGLNSLGPVGADLTLKGLVGIAYKSSRNQEKTFSSRAARISVRG